MFFRIHTLRAGAYDVHHRENDHPDRIDEVPVPGDHNDMFVVISLIRPVRFKIRIRIISIRPTTTWLA